MQDLRDALTIQLSELGPIWTKIFMYFSMVNFIILQCMFLTVTIWPWYHSSINQNEDLNLRKRMVKFLGRTDRYDALQRLCMQLKLN
jgi:hypothetical protein